MAQNRKHLKPDRPIASIVFSDKGKVRLAVEHLPRTQDELELSIGRKFAGALARFHNQRLTEMFAGSGRGDLICRNESGARIKIQVVEVVDPVMTRLSERRASYRDKLLNEFADIFSLFSGCRINLCDEGNEPFLPSLRTHKDETYCQELASNLKLLGDDINSLSVGKRRIRKWQIGSKQVLIFTDCKRFSSNKSHKLTWVQIC